MPKPRWLLFAACLAVLSLPVSHAADVLVNPCREATVRCRAGDRFLDVTYLLRLHNPTDRSAETQLLRSVDVLEGVEGLRRGLVLSKTRQAIRASVPPGWDGFVTLRTKQRISRRPAEGTFCAVIPVPSALSRTIELDLPGRSVELKVSPECIVRPLESEAERSRFSLLPLEGERFTIEWKELPPARRPTYSLHETHRITERAPGFDDEVTLEFRFPDAAPTTVSATIPAGVSIVSIQASHGAAWSIKKDALELSVPEGFSASRFSVTCQLEGRTSAAEDEGAQLLHVPLFAGPGAERHTGRILIKGGLHELNFVVLDGASQVAVEDEQWRLACDFRGPGPNVVVKIVPIELPAHATVESLYSVSAFKVEGWHRLSVAQHAVAIPPLEVLLPAGHIVRSVAACVLVGGSAGSVPVAWSQEGRNLRVALKTPIGDGITVYVTTEWLTGGKPKIHLALPVVQDMSSSEYAVGITPVPDIQIKTGGDAETWRVPPESLPGWMKVKGPSIGYSFRDTPISVELEILPVLAEVRGNIQDHVTVFEERIERASLFLLDIARRAVEELTVVLPAGLTVERVDGPAIEGWEVSEEGSRLTVRFAGPIQGPCHFQLITRRPADAGHLILRGIYLEAAPNLKGWLGIDSEVSVAVRPLEDGRLSIGSVRTDQAPTYLQGFDNKLLYEFYEGRWELELLKETVPAVYSAEVLNVFRFRAAQVDASALFNVEVQEGGVGELDFELPANATSPRLQAPDVVLSQLKDRTLHVRLRGKRTGTLTCRIDYSIVSGMGQAPIELAPVRLLVAKEQSGVVLLTQARPDAGVKVGTPSRGLVPTDAEEEYPAWSYRREHPALAAFSYHDADWKLPVVLTPHPLSEVMLRASIPLAKLDTLVQSGSESVNHLRLYVSNTSKQFLTVDLAEAGPDARLIGTYVYGEPVKPFREGKTRLQLPLFTSEKAARAGMSVLDITYATSHGGLRALRKQSLGLPGLGLNVGQLEWTVRVPEDCRLATVGGNMGKPVSGVAEVESLAGRLLAPVVPFLQKYGLALVVVAAGCAALYVLVRLLWRYRRLELKLLPTPVIILVVVLIGAILVAMMMPALSRARKSASKASQSADLHSVGLAISVYRRDQDGAFPPSIRDLSEGGYLDDRELLEWERQELVYRRLDQDAPSTAVVAYYWPPLEGAYGANVLFNDGVGQWVRLDEEGNLVNPRDGALIARAGAPAAGPVEVAAKTKFAAAGFEAKELAQAFQLEEQMGRRRGRIAGKQVQFRAELVEEALIEASREQIESAVDRYMADHDGDAPASADDLTPYITDARLADALEGFIMPALSRARKESRRTSQQTNMHNVGLGIQMYKNSRGGAFPPSLQDVLAEGYIEDASVLEWEGQELVYRRLERDAPGRAVVAHYWPPRHGGANVLYNDGAVSWVDLDEAGDLINPRSGEVVARSALPPVGGPVVAKAEPQRLMPDRDQLAQSRYNLGLAFLNEGDYVRAEENFRRALDLKGDYEQARRQLGQTVALRSATGAAGKGGVLQLDRSASQAADLGSLEKRLAEQERGFEVAQRQVQVAVSAPARPRAEVAPVPDKLQARMQRASLVKRLGGGRSIGAMPIAIDFPAPATADYQFVKPFLGRAEAALSFRPLSRQTAMLIELGLAACVLIGYVLIRTRRPSTAITFGGVALAVALAVLLAGSPSVATLFASTVLAMAACLGGEAIHLSIRRIRQPKPRES